MYVVYCSGESEHIRHATAWGQVWGWLTGKAQEGGECMPKSRGKKALGRWPRQVGWVPRWGAGGCGQNTGVWEGWAQVRPPQGAGGCHCHAWLPHATDIPHWPASPNQGNGLSSHHLPVNNSHCLSCLPSIVGSRRCVSRRIWSVLSCPILFFFCFHIVSTLDVQRAKGLGTQGRQCRFHHRAKCSGATTIRQGA